jgi:hypothetical protein
MRLYNVSLVDTISYNTRVLTSTNTRKIEMSFDNNRTRFLQGLHYNPLIEDVRDLSILGAKMR